MRTFIAVFFFLPHLQAQQFSVKEVAYPATLAGLGYSHYITAKGSNTVYALIQGGQQGFFLTGNGGTGLNIFTTYSTPGVANYFSMSTKFISGNLVYATNFYPSASGSFNFGIPKNEADPGSGSLTRNVWSHEFQATTSGITEVCKSYAINGAPVPSLINGPNEGNEYIVSPISDTGSQLPSTVYLRTTIGSNGVCTLQKRFDATVPIFQLHKLADGRYIFESVVKTAAIGWSTTAIGFMSASGGITEWLVHSDSAMHPRLPPANEGGNNASLFFEYETGNSLIAYMSSIGGTAFVIDKNGGVVKTVYANEEGLASSAITATSLRGNWFTLKTGNTPQNNILRNKFVVKNWVTDFSYNSDTLGSQLAAGATPAYGYGATVNEVGTAYLFGPKIYQVDIPGVTGFQKPTATLSLNPTTIAPGQSSTLTVHETGCDIRSSEVDHGIGNVKDGDVFTVSPTETTTYTLSCFGFGGSTTTTATITVLASPPSPLISAITPLYGGVSLPRISTVAPGQIVTLWGNLCTDFPPPLQFPLPSPLRTELAGCSIRLTDAQGRLFLGNLYFISKSQVNVQIPAGLSPGAYDLVVRLNNLDSTAAKLQIVSAKPNYVEYVLGEQEFLAALHQDGSYVNTDNPAIGGEIISHYLTGLGNGSMVTMTIDGIIAEVLYAGPQGQYPGLDQINVRIPNAVTTASKIGITVTAADGITTTNAFVLQH